MSLQFMLACKDLICNKGSILSDHHSNMYEDTMSGDYKCTCGASATHCFLLNPEDPEGVRVVDVCTIIQGCAGRTFTLGKQLPMHRSDVAGDGCHETCVCGNPVTQYIFACMTTGVVLGSISYPSEVPKSLEKMKRIPACASMLTDFPVGKPFIEANHRGAGSSCECKAPCECMLGSCLCGQPAGQCIYVDPKTNIVVGTGRCIPACDSYNVEIGTQPYVHREMCFCPNEGPCLCRKDLCSCGKPPVKYVFTCHQTGNVVGVRYRTTSYMV